jgi:hypothetical protein
MMFSMNGFRMARATFPGGDSHSLDRFRAQCRGTCGLEPTVEAGDVTEAAVVPPALPACATGRFCSVQR